MSVVPRLRNPGGHLSLYVHPQNGLPPESFLGTVLRAEATNAGLGGQTHPSPPTYTLAWPLWQWCDSEQVNLSKL